MSEELKETIKLEFTRKYYQALKQCEELQRDSHQAFNTLSELGYSYESITRKLSQEEMQEYVVLNFGKGLSRNLIDVSKKCKNKHRAGKVIDGSQLLLGLATDEKAKCESNTRVKRDSTGKWVKHAGLVNSEFRKALKAKPIKEWSEYERGQALEILHPIIQMIAEIKN